MMKLRRLLPFLLFVLLTAISSAQTASDPGPSTKETRPYKLLSSSRQITIRSTKVIKHVMLWTTGGNRVIEQKDINDTNFRMDIPVNQKTFFLMIALNNGKIYTEKIGLR